MVSTRAPRLVTLAILGVIGCGSASRPARPAVVADGHVVTLYRDRAVVEQRVDVVVSRAGTTTVATRVAFGVDLEDVVVLDRGGLVVTAIRGVVGKVVPAARPPADLDEDELEDDELEDDELEDDELEGDELEPDGLARRPARVPPRRPAPTELELVVDAPRPGRYAVRLGYVTDGLPWSAAYTLTTSARRDQVTLRGAIEIRNTTMLELARAQVYVIDAPLVAWRGRVAEQLGASRGGTAGTAAAVPRALGRLDLRPGDTRIELLPGEPARAMRSVLVFDPVGTEHDHPGAAPVRDRSLGVKARGPVTESFAIARGPEADAGLPGGPVRLFERRADGTLDLLGKARLFDAATRVAGEDTIAIGVAEGVTARRERRELTVDEPRKRLVEEFVLTISNQRPVPIEIVLREHLYRGQNWTLAYHTGEHPEKQGPQQISLRTTVAARSETRVLYVVVYTWP